MSTPQETARQQESVMIAFAEGNWVRERNRSFPNSEWKNYDPNEDSPLWDWERFEYEVKPEERKPVEGEVWVNSIRQIMGLETPFDDYETAVANGWELILVREVLPSENTGGEGV